LQGGRRIQQFRLHDAIPCHVKPSVSTMSQARCACPKEGRWFTLLTLGTKLDETNATRLDSTPRHSTLLHSTTLALVLSLALRIAAGLRSDRAHQRSDDVTQRKPRTHSRLALIQPAAWSCSQRGGRAARRYAHTSAPGRTAATLALRGPTQLWGMGATSAQRNVQRGYGQERLPLGTQPNSCLGLHTQ